MDVVNAILKPVAETLMVPVNNHLGYLISCTKYVRDMGIKLRELNAARVGVEEHMNHNRSNRLEVPAQVTGWLEEVEKINAKVENVPNDVVSCLKLKTRHNLGRKAFKIIEEMESVMTQHSLITWSDHPIPVGRVDSIKPSTSTPSTDHHDDFWSREQTFMEALKALKSDQKSHMIALCGMGGVGKTTMMQRLKKVAKENKMFDYIVEAVIGEKTDPIAIQQAVADYLGVELKEQTKPARADKLRDWFKRNLVGGNKRMLVILDDVWQFVDTKDIGLSHTSNVGVDFKLLLTSRDRHVCIEMGVEPNSIINVNVLTDVEGQSLFCQFAKSSNEEDLDPAIHGIANSIARRCQGLPIAIKIMASTLKGRSKNAWEDALSRLEHHKIQKEVVSEVFKISYDNLQDKETESIFLLCALFPEDFDIRTEELVRYGWGLKLFLDVNTMREARSRLNTCIERLRETNLLNESNDARCIKMHDLVRAFVLHMFSEVEHASIVNHDSMSATWPEENDMISGSCKRISLTCKGMSEIHQYLNNFPNLSLLKLMHGDKSLRFPQDFYGEMKKLQVISYDRMKYPLLPTSPQCSTNLRVLHLHRCSLLKFDCSSIGDHINLEVLSFSGSYIESLPSTIRKLEKLRLLDLTNCSPLCIDDGVLQNFVKLEELYVGADSEYGEAISLTHDNYNEIAEISENLGGLEFEFFENDAQLKKMSFEKLRRFKISVGRALYKHFRNLDKDFRKSRHSLENTLQLVTNKGKVEESGLNKLFEKTEVLFLTVGDMNDLEDVEVKSSHPSQSSSFQNLRVLVISKCAKLKYLFTLGVANTLSKLEHLQVYACYNMKELVHTEYNGEETIKFPKLKILSLRMVPKLSGLCHNVNIIELPQLVELELESIPGFTSIYPNDKLETSSFLKKEVVIPKLETLQIGRMKNLKEIWPCEFGTSVEVNVSMLRVIKVNNCNSLVNVFPCNPMPLIHHLEKLQVGYCGSVEVLFDIDLDSVGETGEGSSSSSLESIYLEELGKLTEVWRIKGADKSRLPIHGFQAVKSIESWNCRRFRNVFTPVTANFDLGALMEISIENNIWYGRNNYSAESSKQSGEAEISQSRHIISNNAFPSCLPHSLRDLRKLKLYNFKGVDVVFEIESPGSRELVTTRDNQQRILCKLEDLKISYMHKMSHVWKCNRNNFMILQKQLPESPFHNLTTIKVKYCNNIKYLFSPLMAKLLSNLKRVKIEYCDGIEEVVSNREDEDEEKTTFTSTSTSTSTHTSCTNLFPCLDSLTLLELPKLTCIGGGGCANGGNNEASLNNYTTTTPIVDQFTFSQACGVSWSLCQYAREIEIRNCGALLSAIPWYAAGQMQKLQVLTIFDCRGMKEVFETQGINNNNNKSTGCDEASDGGIQQAIPRLNDVIMLKLLNLKKLSIHRCDLLEHIFTFSALESLRQLEELTVDACCRLKVIVKEEEQTTTTSSKEVVVFPRLKSLKLVNLPELVGFFLGMNEFRWPLLETVTIKNCPRMTVFSPGGSTAPKLKYVHTSLGKHSFECGLNFHVHHQETPLFPSLDSISSCPATSEVVPFWSFHNLIELDVGFDTSLKKIIPSNELLQLQKLEKISLYHCKELEEIFEAGRNSSSGVDDESQTTTTLVKLPNLTQVYLFRLDSLRYIWKWNEWTTFEFPNLTKLSIESCRSLKHVFSSSMVGSLLQLQELRIRGCALMEEVIVKESNVGVEEEEKEEEYDGKTNQLIRLPRLKSLTLEELPRLKGFCLETVDFSFPLLDTLEITDCPAITTFTNGNSATPHLKEIDTNFRSDYAGEDINSFIKLTKRKRDLHRQTIKGGVMN